MRFSLSVPVSSSTMTIENDCQNNRLIKEIDKEPLGVFNGNQILASFVVCAQIQHGDKERGSALQK